MKTHNYSTNDFIHLSSSAAQSGGGVTPYQAIQFHPKSVGFSFKDSAPQPNIAPNQNHYQHLVLKKPIPKTGKSIGSAFPRRSSEYVDFSRFCKDQDTDNVAASKNQANDGGCFVENARSAASCENLTTNPSPWVGINPEDDQDDPISQPSSKKSSRKYRFLPRFLPNFFRKKKSKAATEKEEELFIAIPNLPNLRSRACTVNNCTDTHAEIMYEPQACDARDFIDGTCMTRVPPLHPSATGGGFVNHSDQMMPPQSIIVQPNSHYYTSNSYSSQRPHHHHVRTHSHHGQSQSYYKDQPLKFQDESSLITGAEKVIYYPVITNDVHSSNTYITYYPKSQPAFSNHYIDYPSYNNHIYEPTFNRDQQQQPQENLQTSRGCHYNTYNDPNNALTLEQKPQHHHQQHVPSSEFYTTHNRRGVNSYSMFMKEYHSSSSGSKPTLATTTAVPASSSSCVVAPQTPARTNKSTCRSTCQDMHNLTPPRFNAIGARLHANKGLSDNSQLHVHNERQQQQQQYFMKSTCNDAFETTTTTIDACNRNNMTGLQVTAGPQQQTHNNNNNTCMQNPSCTKSTALSAHQEDVSRSHQKQQPKKPTSSQTQSQHRVLSLENSIAATNNLSVSSSPEHKSSGYATLDTANSLLANQASPTLRPNQQQVVCSQSQPPQWSTRLNQSKSASTNMLQVIQPTSSGASTYKPKQTRIPLNVHKEIQTGSEKPPESGQDSKFTQTYPEYPQVSSKLNVLSPQPLPSTNPNFRLRKVSLGGVSIPRTPDSPKSQSKYHHAKCYFEFPPTPTNADHNGQQHVAQTNTKEESSRIYNREFLNPCSTSQEQAIKNYGRSAPVSPVLQTKSSKNPAIANGQTTWYSPRSPPYREHEYSTIATRVGLTKNIPTSLPRDQPVTRPKQPAEVPINPTSFYRNFEHDAKKVNQFFDSQGASESTLKKIKRQARVAPPSDIGSIPSVNDPRPEPRAGVLTEYGLAENHFLNPPMTDFDKTLLVLNWLIHCDKEIKLDKVCYF